MKTWQILVLLGVVVGVSYLVFIRPTMNLNPNPTGDNPVAPPTSPIGSVPGSPSYVAPALAIAVKRLQGGTNPLFNIPITPKV